MVSDSNTHTSPLKKKPHVVSKKNGQTAPQQSALEGNTTVLKVTHSGDKKLVQKVENAKKAPVPVFQALADSITAVQGNMNAGLDSLKKMLTQPVVGLAP